MPRFAPKELPEKYKKKHATYQKKPKKPATKKSAVGRKMLTVGSSAQVFRGTAKHTSGGLTKKDLMIRNGRIVSVKQSRRGMANKWIISVNKAKKNLGLQNKFVLINRGAEGVKLYKEAKRIYG
jgi:hypothetical protein